MNKILHEGILEAQISDYEMFIYMLEKYPNAQDIILETLKIKLKQMQKELENGKA